MPNVAIYKVVMCKEEFLNETIAELEELTRKNVDWFLLIPHIKDSKESPRCHEISPRFKHYYLRSRFEPWYPKVEEVLPGIIISGLEKETIYLDKNKIPTYDPEGHVGSIDVISMNSIEVHTHEGKILAGGGAKAYLFDNGIGFNLPEGFLPRSRRLDQILSRKGKAALY